MAAIQAIHIRGWEDRPEPKPHTVYRIEIQASVRSWQMWRRYSEFADLHVELTKSCGAPPPAPLPPKHPFAFLRGSKTSPALLEERRAALERRRKLNDFQRFGVLLEKRKRRDVVRKAVKSAKKAAA